MPAASLWTFGEIAQAAESRARTPFVLDRSGDLLTALWDAEIAQRDSVPRETRNDYSLTGRCMEPSAASGMNCDN